MGWVVTELEPPVDGKIDGSVKIDWRSVVEADKVEGVADAEEGVIDVELLVGKIEGSVKIDWRLVVEVGVV